MVEPSSYYFSAETGEAVDASVEKTKTQEFGATKNKSDSFLRNRLNHTGSQAISTITNLQSILNNKAALVHTHTEADITNLDKYTQDEVDALIAGVSTGVFGVINVRDYGATGDGITDDTASIKDAFNASEAGNTVLFPKGIYLVQTSNEISPPSGVIIKGYGATVRFPSGGTVADPGGDNGIFFNNDISPLTDVIVLGIKFITEEPEVNCLWLGNRFIEATGFNRAIVKDCQFIGAEDTNCGRGAVIQLNELIFVNNYSKYVHGHALFAAHRAIVQGNKVEFAGVSSDYVTWLNINAFALKNSEKLIVSNNIVYFSGGTAITTPSQLDDDDVISVTIDNNIIVAAGLTGISSGIKLNNADISTDIKVTNNVVSGYTCSPGADLHGGIEIGGTSINTQTKSTIISGNIVNYLAPFEKWDSDNFQVIGNPDDINGEPINNLKKRGGYVGSQSGISCGASGSLVSNNVIYYAPTIGIKVFDDVLGVTGVSVSDNILVNCGYNRQHSDIFTTWTTSTSYALGDCVKYGDNVYRAKSSGTSGGTPPTHTDGEASDGGVDWYFSYEYTGDNDVSWASNGFFVQNSDSVFCQGNLSYNQSPGANASDFIIPFYFENLTRSKAFNNHVTQQDASITYAYFVSASSTYVTNNIYKGKPHLTISGNTANGLLGSPKSGLTLDVLSVEYQAGTGYTRYNYDAGDNLASAYVGDRLVVNDSFYSENNGTFEIVTVNNSSKYIEVLNGKRSDISKDESSTSSNSNVRSLSTRSWRAINTGEVRAIGENPDYNMVSGGQILINETNFYFGLNFVGNYQLPDADLADGNTYYFENRTDYTQHIYVFDKTNDTINNDKIYAIIPQRSSGRLVCANGNYNLMFDRHETSDEEPDEFNRSVATYLKGQFVLSTDISNGVYGWVCTTEGTTDTIGESVTAETTAGSPDIIVNSSLFLRYGQVVTIPDAGITRATIENISGTTVTLSENATSNETSVTVQYIDPKFNIIKLYNSEEPKEFNLSDYGGDITGNEYSDDALDALMLDAETANSEGYNIRIIIPTGIWKFKRFHKHTIFSNSTIEIYGTIQIPEVSELERYNGSTFESISGLYDTPDSAGNFPNALFVNQSGGLDNVTFIGGKWISISEDADPRLPVRPFQIGDDDSTEITESTNIKIKDLYTENLANGIYCTDCELQIDNTVIKNTLSSAIFIQRYTYLSGHGNKGEYIGVNPLDLNEAWRNVGYLVGRYGKDCNNFGCDINITGGTAIQLSSTNSGVVRNITLDGITINGAGLGGIEVNGRFDASSAYELYNVSVTNCKITGVNCSNTLGGDHNGISFGNQKFDYAENALIEGNVVDCCASWETYDYATGKIVGNLSDPSGTPYNPRKQPNDTEDPFNGNGIGGATVSDSVGGTRNAKVLNNTILNFPTCGIQASLLVDSEIKGNYIADCGWDRDLSDDNKTSVQAGINWSKAINTTVSDNIVVRHGRLVNSTQNTTPYYGVDPIACTYKNNKTKDSDGNVESGHVILSTGTASQMGYSEVPSLSLGQNSSSGDSFTKKYQLSSTSALKVLDIPSDDILFHTGGSLILSPEKRKVVFSNTSDASIFLYTMIVYEGEYILDLTDATANMALYSSSGETINGIDRSSTFLTLFAGEIIKFRRNNNNSDIILTYLKSNRYQELTDASPITWDVSILKTARVELDSATSTRELSIMTGACIGDTYTLVVEQDSSGDADLTFNSNYTVPNTVYIDKNPFSKTVLQFFYLSDSFIYVLPVNPPVDDSYKKITTVDAATYSILPSDETIAVDYTDTGSVTLTLPALDYAFDNLHGKVFVIKDTGANASVNNITIERADSDTIIGSSTGQTSVTLASNGASIFIQAKDISTWMVY